MKGKKTGITQAVRTGNLSKGFNFFLRVFGGKKRRRYWLFLAIVGCALAAPYPAVAMWVTFALAGYSVIANDSIQTIGTFISSNIGKVKWYFLWLFMATIFVVITYYSWSKYGGDVSHQRLSTKGLDVAPISYQFTQMIAPLVLIVLTHYRIPVSTSLLMLSVFATKASSIQNIILKSFAGYMIAFSIAIVVWFLVSYFLKKIKKKSFGRRASLGWYVAQWVTSGLLWAAWITQDAANIAVVLPRALSATELLVFMSYITLGLGILFYVNGGRIQHVVKKKSYVGDVRATTLIDFVYALVLYYFKTINEIPMSTTWVFIGLLGGREVAFSFFRKRGRGRKAMRMIASDVMSVFIGLCISITMATIVNKSLWESIKGLLLPTE